MKNVNRFKSTLVVVGGSIAATPAAALELGEIKVHSSLGQPLRASISYALGPNEAISNTCVSLMQALPDGGLQSLNKGSTSVGTGVIMITGSTAVREPIVSVRLSVRCQYTAQLIRDYTLFIDPAETQAEPIAAPTAARVASQPQLARPPVIRQSQPVAQQPAARTPIENASGYQVRPGDSLSEIAQRIENRPVGLQTAINAIFAANPDAFIDNDPNKIKAGSWLTIPSFGAEASDAVDAVTGSTVYEPPAFPAPEPVVDETFAIAEPPVQAAPATTAEALADLQPGDVIVNTDNPYLESVSIPDTQLAGPETTSSSPNVPVAVITQRAAEETSGTNWLLWLGSAGIAFVLGLLLFGRRLIARFGSTPIGPATPQRRATAIATEYVEAIAEPDAEIADDAPTAENLALDADLAIGTGLQEGAEVDVASDFAFESTAELDIDELDIELTEEMAADYETSETDIIPPINIDESSILESEVLPDDDHDDDGDEYDMSVIVDATKMPDPEDVTERDLEAVEVDYGDDTLNKGDYSINQEVDYKIVEQDYEDELSATQALNAEILKASEDLATRLEEDEPVEDQTAQISLTGIHEVDVTAQLTRVEFLEEHSNDDTGVSPTGNVEENDKTAEIPTKGSKAG